MAREIKIYNNMRSILKDFYSGYKHSDAAIKHLPDTMKIGDIVERVMKNDPVLNNTLQSIISNWKFIVGDEAICDSSRPIKLYNYNLVVEVNNSSLLMELKRYFSRKIINRCNGIVGDDNYEVKRITFIPKGSV